MKLKLFIINLFFITFLFSFDMSNLDNFDINNLTDEQKQILLEKLKNNKNLLKNKNINNYNINDNLKNKIDYIKENKKNDFKKEKNVNLNIKKNKNNLDTKEKLKKLNNKEKLTLNDLKNEQKIKYYKKIINNNISPFLYDKLKYISKKLIKYNSYLFSFNKLKIKKSKLLRTISYFIKEKKLFNSIYTNFIYSGYRLNYNDILKIDIFGRVNKTFLVKVNNKGNIYFKFLPKPIYVYNKTLSEVQKILKTTLKNTFPYSLVNVDIQNIGPIKILIKGYVKNSAGVKIYNNLIYLRNLLYDIKLFKYTSIRNIKLIRNNKVYNIDFYKIFFENKNKFYLLKNNDIIIFPKTNNLIYLLGEIKFKGIYEFKTGEKIKDILKIAGLKNTANKNKIILIRTVNGKQIVYIKKINDNFKLLPNDIIYIRKISNKDKKYITIYGNIDYPGIYELEKNMKLKDVFKKIHILYDTNKNYLILRRENKIVTFSLKNIPNIKMKNHDEIYILTKAETTGLAFVQINGNDVNLTNNKILYYENMKLKDAIFNCGLENINNLYKFIKLKRFDEKTNKYKIYILDFYKNQNFLLHPYDNIEIYNNKKLYNKFVEIYGNVNYPNKYIYSENLTVKDVIKMAGGLKYNIGKNSIEIKRTINDKIIEVKSLNYKIFPFDVIYVKNNYYYDINNPKKVKIMGAVKYPGEYIIVPGEKIYDLIKRAGGLKKKAYLYGTVFTRKSIKDLKTEALIKKFNSIKNKILFYVSNANNWGEENSQKIQLFSILKYLDKQIEKYKPIGRIIINIDKNLTKFKNSSYNIELKDGDRIYIPYQKDTILLMGEINSPSAYVFNKNKSKALYYIDLAGGITDNADNKFIVVHANGKIDFGKIGGFFNKKDINIKPGDVIIVPNKIITKTNYTLFKSIIDVLYKTLISVANLKMIGGF